MRKTPVYNELMRTFGRAPRPHTVGELLEALYKRGLQPNKTTVYRQLEKMENEELVRRVNISDLNATYEMVSGAHHHHVVCEQCGDLRDIVLNNEKELLKAIAAQGFTTSGHKLEIFGLCATCVKK